MTVTAGIDVGSTYTKAAIVAPDGAPPGGQATVRSGDDRHIHVEERGLGRLIDVQNIRRMQALRTAAPMNFRNIFIAAQTEIACSWPAVAAILGPRNTSRCLVHNARAIDCAAVGTSSI